MAITKNKRLVALFLWKAGKTGLRVQLKPFTFRVLWIRSSAMLPKLVSIPKINFCKKMSISHGSSYLLTFPNLSSWPHQSSRKNKYRAPDINKEPTTIINWFVLHLIMMIMMIILPLILLLFLCNSQLSLHFCCQTPMPSSA